jgi:hypothetical protein
MSLDPNDVMQQLASRSTGFLGLSDSRDTSNSYLKWGLFILNELQGHLTTPSRESLPSYGSHAASLAHAVVSRGHMINGVRKCQRKYPI